MCGLISYTRTYNNVQSNDCRIDAKISILFKKGEKCYCPVVFRDFFLYVRQLASILLYFVRIMNLKMDLRKFIKLNFKL